ncbi:phospholipase-like protein [Tanacetum coccineum]
MLRKQCKVDDSHYDMPLIYYIEGHSLHFGRPELALITDLPFGPISFALYISGELKFHNRVFPHKLGLSVTNLDVIGDIEDEETFGKLGDEDFIRLCLILALEVIFMGRLLTCPVDDTLFRLVENLEDWNCFTWGERIWTHLYDQIKNVIQKHSDEHYFGLKKDRMFGSLSHLKDVIVGGLKIQKLYQEHLGGRKSLSFKNLIVVTFLQRVSSSLCTTDISTNKKWLKDEVISDLNVLARERNEEYGDYLVEDELRLCLEEEERMRLEQEKKHYRRAEDVSRLFRSLDTVWLTPNIERFISQPGQLKFKFPWSKDYTVVRHFWLTLACLDPSRKGWLSEETCGSIICGMGDLRMLTGPWSVVTLFSYFCKTARPCFMSTVISMPLHRAMLISGDTYDYEWRDWYVPVREWLQERLPVILEGAKVFDKKGINQSDYCIRFKLADSVPKQGGTSRVVVVRALDELAVVSCETKLPNYMRFFFLQQVAEAKAFAKLIREKYDNARACLAKLVVMIGEMEAMDDSLVVFDILDCLKESKELENITLKALSNLIAHAEEAIRLKEGHVDVMDLEIYCEDDMPILDFIEAYVVCPKTINKPFLPYRSKTGTLIIPTGEFIGVYYSEELKYAVGLGYKVVPISGYLFEIYSFVFVIAEIVRRTFLLQAYTMIKRKCGKTSKEGRIKKVKSGMVNDEPVESKVVLTNYKRAIIHGKAKMVEVEDVGLVQEKADVGNKEGVLIRSDVLGLMGHVNKLKNLWYRQQRFRDKLGRTNELPENYCVFEVNYDGVFMEYPLRCSLEEGLTIVEGDGDMNKMYDMTEKYGLINFYIAHIPKNLVEYYYKNLSIDESDEGVKSKLKTHEKRKLEACSMSPQELFEWAEQQAGTPYLRTPPLKARRKGIEFPCKNLYGDFLHCDSVADEVELHDNWKHEGLSVDGYIYVVGSSKCCDLVHESVGYNGHSLPNMDKECFSNDVVLDAVVPDTLAYTLPLVLKKCRSKVSVTRKRSCLNSSKITSLRKGLGKRVGCGAKNQRWGSLTG